MTEHVAFLMKDILLFAASFYLLKQDVARVALPKEASYVAGTELSVDGGVAQV